MLLNKEDAMGYFYNKHTFYGDSGESLFHRAEYGTANSTSKEKGTDNKLNNTSEYNAKYYQENKEKWEDNKESSSSKKNATKSEDDDLYYDKDGKARFGHKDYDPNDPDFARTDGKGIEGTELKTFTNANGSLIILGKGIKFSFPPGTKLTSAMTKKIAEIEKAGSNGNKEQYVAKMLNAVTGFADKQGLNTGEKKKSSKKSSAKKEESSNTSSKKDLRDWDAIKTDYYDKEKKKKS